MERSRGRNTPPFWDLRTEQFGQWSMQVPKGRRCGKYCIFATLECRSAGQGGAGVKRMCNISFFSSGIILGGGEADHGGGTEVMEEVKSQS